MNRYNNTRGVCMFMRLNLLIMIFQILTVLCPFDCKAGVSTRVELEKVSHNPNVILVASTGRSGSTMLFDQINRYNLSHGKKFEVIKTHLLPPDACFLGKAVFIFSNPDQATDSAFYRTFNERNFGFFHFKYVETADRVWLNKIKGTDNQTMEDNLLAYDALGINKHLEEWLFVRTTPSSLKTAQILAIKYENLWDNDTLEAIRVFLNFPDLQLPKKRPRGIHKVEYPRYAEIKAKYNLGTDADPRYAAYDDARVLWEQAPPYQFLKITFIEWETKETNENIEKEANTPTQNTKK